MKKKKWYEYSGRATTEEKNASWIGFRMTGLEKSKPAESDSLIKWVIITSLVVIVFLIILIPLLFHSP